MGTIMNGKKWSGACANGKKVGGLVKNGIAFFKAIIDNVKPDVKYLSYRVDGDSASDPKPYYATNGDKLYVSIAVSEELAEKPIATFTDSEEKQFASELEFTFINNVGQYIYTSYVEINSNLDVADGVLKVDVTNFKDKAGNILEKTFTSSDIVVDRTPIQKNHIYILNTISSKRQYIRNGEYFMVEMLLLEKSETTPIFTYGHSKAIELPFSSQPTWAPDKYLYRFNQEKIDNEILNLLEGEEINFVISNIKDKAGNETIFTNDDISYTAEYGRLTYDNDAPRISGVLDGEIYTNPVTPIIEDPTIDTITLNGNNFISGTTILESGHYELIATDKAQNKTEVVFEITNDTTPPQKLSVNFWIPRLGNVKEQYAKAGDTLQMSARFNEDLKYIPTFKYLNGGNSYEITNVEKTVAEDGFTYTGSTVLPNTLEQGSITIEISNIEDLAGNKAQNITEASNGRIMNFDSIKPERKTLGITGFFNENYDPHYITYGKGVRISLYFDEELSKVPKVKFENFNKEYTAVVGQDTDSSKNFYSYIIDVPAGDVNADNFSEGEIKFQVYGYEDLAGNEGDTLTNEDINSLTQTKVIIDNTPASKEWLYILNLNDPNYRTSISDGETLLVEATFNEPLQTMPTLEIGNSSFIFTDEEKLAAEDHYAYRVKVNINSSLGLEEGEVIPFEITNIIDLAGNITSSLDNNDVNYREDLGYGQVIYENPLVSLSFFCSTKGDSNIKEARLGDSVRTFIRFNQDLDSNNLPIIIIGGIEKRLALSNSYSDGSKDYGTDVELVSEMNLEVGKKIPFVITNVVLANGNKLPDFNQDDTTSLDRNEVIYLGE